MIEDKINIKKITRYSVQSRDRIFVKDYEFWSFAKNVGKNVIRTWGASLLGNLLIGKGTIWAGEGTIRAHQGFNAALSFNTFWDTQVLSKRT